MLFVPIILLTSATFAMARPHRWIAVLLCFGAPAIIVVATFLIWATSVGFFRYSAQGPIFWPAVPGAFVGAVAALLSAAYIVRGIRRRLQT
jgi:hypothetical protein